MWIKTIKQNNLKPDHHINVYQCMEIEIEVSIKSQPCLSNPIIISAWLPGRANAEYDVTIAADQCCMIFFLRIENNRRQMRRRIPNPCRLSNSHHIP